MVPSDTIGIHNQHFFSCHILAGVASALNMKTNGADIKGILFDKDGTLFDYHQTWMPLNHKAARVTARGDEQLAHALLISGGWNPETDTVASGSLLAAHTNQEIAEAWMDQAPGWELDHLTDVLNTMFTEGGTETARPVTDLPVFLQELRTLNLALGVATSDNESSALAMLRHVGVAELMDFIAGYDSGHGPKPEPGMVYAFCDTTNLRLSEVIMVGDNRHDMEMGRNAGVAFCVGVLTGTSNRNELEAEADYVLDDVTGLPVLLRQLQ